MAKAIRQTDRQQIDKITAELNGVVESATRDIARSLVTELPAVTPRDSGLTAANWRASRGRPVHEPVGDRSASGVGSAKAAQAAGRGEIDSFKLGDRTLHVSNPLPTARALNDGSSTQEPRGFVQRSIQKAVALVRVARAVVGRRGR